MNIKIVTEAPAWFLLLCILAGAAYAGVLYWRERLKNGMPSWLVGTLGFLRFLSVSVIAFLLMSPLLKTVFREVEKPVIVIATDYSESITANKDSAWYKNDFPDQLKELETSLNENYTVVQYAFGDHFSEGADTAFNHKETDISQLFEELETRYSDRNLGAVILATDGIYNRGTGPLYAAEWLKAPLFCIAAGDTTVRKDVLIENVRNNSVAFLGNKFPAEVIVHADKCKGENVTVTVSKGGQVINSQRIAINNDAFTATVPFELQATVTGIQRYSVSVSSVNGEDNSANNRHDFFVEVLDSRQKILIAAAAPHPDIAALKLSIENNDNYQVTTALINDLPQDISKFNLAILHSIPSDNSAGQKLLSDLDAAGIPIWYITGVQSKYTLFNSRKTGITIEMNGNRPNDCQPVIVRDFPLFAYSEKTLSWFQQLPAVQVPFAGFEANNSVSVLLKQKIGALNTDYPLLSFSDQNGRKSAMFTGEGIWRWRLADFSDNGNHDAFNEFIGKIIQYLSLVEEKSFFRVTAPNSVPENDRASFDAEVYNKSFELVQNTDVFLDITDEQGRKYNNTFSKTTRAYHLDAPLLPPGEYTWEARTKIGTENYSKKGKFVVTPLLAEKVVTTANHRLLFNLSAAHNGNVVYPKELSKLADLIRSREDIRPVIYNPQKMMDLIQIWWIFAILMGLLTIEWFIRKRNGAY